jgi:putative glycosyltransferase (TIGR04372 family)
MFNKLKLIGFTVIRHVLGFICAIVILPVLYIVLPFKRIKISHLIEARIGHLVANTEVFLRRKSLQQLNQNDWHVFISNKPANKALLDIYQRKITIVKSRLLSKLFFIILPIFSKTQFYQELDFEDFDNYHLFNTTSPLLFLNCQEQDRGDRLLAEMGLGPDDWFVCFHARDNEYLNRHWPQKDWARHDIRNCSIYNYAKAAEVITNQGGFVIRMGAETDQPLWQHNNPKIIDYSLRFRSDFMDVFLPANCRFFLGCASGLYFVSWAFGRPIAHTNLIPIGAGPFAIQDLYIPKLFKRKADGALVHFDDVMRMGLIGRGCLNSNKETYDALGIEPVESNERDIAQLCKEMLNQTSGEKPCSADQVLQEQFCKKYLTWLGRPENLSKPAAGFLQKHSDLINLDAI